MLVEDTSETTASTLRKGATDNDESPKPPSINGTAPATTSPLQTTVSHKTTASTEEPYSVFSRWRKLMIVGIAAFAGLLSPLSSTIYFPAIESIAQDFDISLELVNLTISIYLVFQAIAPSFWGALADSIGRRPVYIIILLVYVAACVGLALTRTYWLLLVLRMVQASGSSAVIAVGAGTLGDIASPAERGGFFGLFALGPMVGPAIGPIIGGFLAQDLGWRWIFWFLTILASVPIIVVFLFLPETLRSIVGNGSIQRNPTPVDALLNWLHDRHENHSDRPAPPPKPPIGPRRLPNPLQSLMYFRYPDVAVSLLYNSVLYASYYSIATSLPAIFATTYGLNESQVGLCYLCNGLGGALGSFVGGKLMDRDYRIMKKQMGLSTEKEARSAAKLDFPIERARLRTMIIPVWFFCGSFFAYGWAIQAVVSLAVPLVLQFVIGFTSTTIFNVFSTLMIDLFPGNSASITASNNLSRCLFGAIATIVVNPGITALGPGWFFTVIGFINVASLGLVVAEWNYGMQWRKRRAEKLAREKKAREGIL